MLAVRLGFVTGMLDMLVSHPSGHLPSACSTTTSFYKLTLCVCVFCLCLLPVAACGSYLGPRQCGCRQSVGAALIAGVLGHRCRRVPAWKQDVVDTGAAAVSACSCICCSRRCLAEGGGAQAVCQALNVALWASQPMHV